MLDRYTHIQKIINSSKIVMNMLFTTFSTRKEEPILIFLILISKSHYNTAALFVTGETITDI